MNTPVIKTSPPALLAMLAIALTPQLMGQQQATTLFTLSNRADVIALATVSRNTDPSPALHRVEFRLDRALAGSLGATFTLTEQADRCCGRALVSTIPGQRHLLFLQRIGAILHPLGGERGLLRPNPRLLAHVERLLAATTPQLRQEALVGALDSPDPRVRMDAALALPSLPTLTNDGDTIDKVLSALRRELPQGSTMLPSLLDVTVRVNPVAAASALTPIYLTTHRDDTSKLLRSTLCRLPAERIRDQLFMAKVVNTKQTAARLRAAELLLSMPDAANVRILDLMLARTRQPRLELAITEALLAADVPAVQLAARVPIPVLELAQRRRAERARFRVNRPRVR